jgi:hypothetical protein
MKPDTLGSRSRVIKTIMHVCFCLVVAAMSISAQSAAPNSDLSRFFAAVKTGDLSQVRASISSGVAINARTPDGMTPLMLAADSGQVTRRSSSFC